MPKAVYFDSCVFIELLQKGNAKRYDCCEPLLKAAQAGKIQIVTSAITLTEVNKIDGSKALPEAQSQEIMDFFENPYISIRPVDRETAKKAHEFVRTHSLTNLDAIHIATAVRVDGITVFYTYDDAKKKRRGLIRHSMKIGTPPLLIEVPPDPDKNTLFAEEFKTADSDDDPQLPAQDRSDAKLVDAKA